MKVEKIYYFLPQILLLEMSKEEVIAICGPGAVWPEFKKEEVLNEVYLEIEAGSTGKPNKAAELQNIERIIPFLIQIPGIDPKFLVRVYRCSLLLIRSASGNLVN